MLMFYKKIFADSDVIVQTRAFDMLSIEQQAEFTNAFPELSKNIEAMHLFFDAMENAFKQIAKGTDDTVALAYKAAMELAKYQHRDSGVEISFDEKVVRMNERGNLEQYVGRLVLMGVHEYGNRVLVDAGNIVSELQKSFPELRGMNELLGFLEELDLLTQSFDLARTAEERQRIVAEINATMGKISEIFLGILQSGEIRGRTGGLRSRMYDLIAMVLGEAAVVRGGPEFRGQGRTVQEETLTVVFVKTVFEDEEGRSYMSEFTRDIFHRLIVPLALTYELDKHNTEFEAILTRLKVENPSYYARYNTVNDVIFRIIELSSKIAEFIREKNAQIDEEMLLRENREELAELEIFRLSKPMLNLIASLLGIEAKYLNLAVLKGLARNLETQQFSGNLVAI